MRLIENWLATSTGVLYFGTAGGGLAVIDPRNFSESQNKLPPPFSVQQITADGKDYVISSNLELPPLVRDLRIDFTALSFNLPFSSRMNDFDSERSRLYCLTFSSTKAGLED
jgi:hypothetical protein